MKIAFITTLGTNIGDDFVREGIRAALDPARKHEPYFINKHRPVQTSRESVPGDAPQRLTDKILDADAVIQCGAPLYWNLGPYPGQKCSNAEWIESLWYDRIAKVCDRKPVLNITGGACQGYFGSAQEITGDAECRRFVLDVHGFSHLLTVRDRISLEVNESLGLSAHLQPCASILAWRRSFPQGRRANTTGPVALNFMRLAGHYESGGVDANQWRLRFREIALLLAELGQEILPIAHSPEERQLLERLLPGTNVFYSSDYLDYFPVYAACRGGIFNRVHGAMLLAGRGAPSVVIGNDSRAHTLDQVGLPRFHASEAEPEAIVRRLLDMIRDDALRARLLEIEERTFAALSSQIENAIPAEGSRGIARQEQSILIVHSGGLGDLVLLSQLVGEIKQHKPGWRVRVACQARFTDLLGLYPFPPDEILPIEFDPYAWTEPGLEQIPQWCSAIERFRNGGVDVCLLAGLQPTSFSWLLPAALRPGAALCCSRIEEPSALVGMVRDHLGLSAGRVRRLHSSCEMHELGRYREFAKALGIYTESPLAWKRPDDARAGDYLVCFPSGSPGTRVKRWPVERFEQALGAFQARWQMRVVLLGDAAERRDLEAMAERIGGAEVCAGRPLAEAARVLAGARIYFGNDTGPMHLAAAYGIPGVAIYGGGHWPAYAPWGPGSIGLVAPLPCFGCDWDCVFDQGMCVESIPLDEVSKALDDAMERPDGPAEARVLSGTDPRLYEIAAKIAPKYRSLQSDRARRLDAIRELTRASLHHGAKIDRLENEKRAVMAELEDKNRRIAELEKAASERLEALLVTDAALRELREQAQGG